MIEINKNPSARELRQFAAIWLPAAMLLLGAAHSVRTSEWFAFWIVLGIAAAVAAIGLLIPSAIRPLFVSIMYLTYPIGWLVSHGVLVILFFLVLTPIGLFRRLFCADPLNRAFNKSTDSYWLPRSEGRPAKDYFKQF